MSGILVWACGCMYVCMYVCTCINGFIVELYGFTYSLYNFLVCAAHNAITMEVVDWEDRRWRQAREWVQRYRRQLLLNKLMRNKIMVTGGRWLVHRHLINLLRSLTRKWDRQRTAQCCLECSSPFPLIKLSTCTDWGTWCTCVYLVYDCAFWWEVTVVEAYQSALCWYKWFTPQIATYLQSLILNLVYRVACPLCHQVVLVRRLLCVGYPKIDLQ